MKSFIVLAILVTCHSFRIPAHFARSSRLLSADVAQVPPSTDDPEVRNVPVTDVPVTDAPATDAPATDVPAQEAVQEKVDTAAPTITFALNLGLCKNATLPSCSRNSVFSPLSITSTMSLLMAGSSGSSYDQLRTALGYRSAGDDDINAAYKDVLGSLTSLNQLDGIQLNVANAIFSTDQLLPDYVDKVRQFYSGQVLLLNATDESGGADQINRWVSEGTAGKITDIVASLPPDTKMIAANVVYLNANWQEPFDAKATVDEPFHVSENETVSVPTMFTTQTVDYSASKDLGCRMVALPYKGGKLALYLVVPIERNGLDSLLALESKLADASVLNGLLDHMKSTDVAIQLPKFSFRQKLNLKSSLNDMGVVDLFNAGRADLMRMSSTPGAAVDDIVHEAVIEVNESGTEAAGATVVLVTRDGVHRSFVADQPFLFFVMERSSRTVLFSGRVVRP